MSEAQRHATRYTGVFLAIALVWLVATRTVTGFAGPLFDAVFVGAGATVVFAAVLRAWSRNAEGERRLRNLVDQPLVGVYLIQGDRFRFVNQKLADILGYSIEELTDAVPVRQVIHDDDRGMVLERMRARLEGATDTVNHRFRAVRKDGGAVPVEVWGRSAEWQGAPAVAGVLIDYSSRQMLARQLRRSQKLESIGEFTGAVAHDFNNVLTAIIAPVQLALEDMAPDDPLRSRLREMELAAERGAALSRQLLAFGRKQVVQPRPHDLNEIVERVRAMLDRLVGSTVTLETDLALGLPAVMVDVTQVEQVLVNLVVNARDAMPDGGSVTISTAAVDPVDDPVRTDVPAPHGYVSVTVTDTGHGFDESTRARLFEPYFTTKPEGTGLGLSTVFGIAAQAGGFVRASSPPGSGAAFRVYLPAVLEPAEAIAPDRPAARAVREGTERILVVEDQAPVRQVIVRVLERFGYDVTETSTGAEATHRFDATAEGPDLVLTDIMLPGMTGPEIVRELRARKPDLRVLYMSGYADAHHVEEAQAGGDWLFLPKPFSVDDLLDKVRSALDRPPTEGPGIG